MNDFSYRRLAVIALLIALTGCASTPKKVAIDQQSQGFPPTGAEESSTSTGTWPCARYNEAATADPSTGGMGRIVQEYATGYVIGLFEGQGKNLPQTEANLSKIQQLLGTICTRNSTLTIQQAADNTGQLLLQQLAGFRAKNPVPPPGTTGAMACSDYIDSKNSGEPAAVIARHAAHNWADGYVTAVLESAHRIFQPNANKARVLQALNATCTDNPRLTIQDAAETVAKPLIASASRQRPGSRSRRPSLDEEAAPRWGTVVE
jgi:hypothetical protein